MRRGRKRKSGRREPSGRLAQHKRPSVKEIAASMPHRRALGTKAADQKAEGLSVLRSSADAFRKLGRITEAQQLEKIILQSAS